MRYKEPKSLLVLGSVLKMLALLLAPALVAASKRDEYDDQVSSILNQLSANDYSLFTDDYQYLTDAAYLLSLYGLFSYAIPTGAEVSSALAAALSILGNTEAWGALSTLAGSLSGFATAAGSGSVATASAGSDSDSDEESDSDSASGAASGSASGSRSASGSASGSGRSASSGSVTSPSSGSSSARGGLSSSSGGSGSGGSGSGGSSSGSGGSGSSSSGNGASSPYLAGGVVAVAAIALL